MSDNIKLEIKVRTPDENMVGHWIKFKLYYSNGATISTGADDWDDAIRLLCALTGDPLPYKDCYNQWVIRKRKAFHNHVINNGYDTWVTIEDLESYLDKVEEDYSNPLLNQIEIVGDYGQSSTLLAAIEKHGIGSQHLIEQITKNGINVYFDGNAYPEAVGGLFGSYALLTIKNGPRSTNHIKLDASHLIHRNP